MFRAATDANVKIVNPYTDEFEKAQEWRKSVPKAGPPVMVHLPVPQTFTLANGLKVYVVPDHALPVLSASVVSRAGSESNPEGKAGLATLTAQTMGEATTSMDMKALADAQERIGTRIGVAASMDGASGSMTVLTNHAHEGMKLFSDVIESPALNDADLDRLRKQRLIAIQQETDNVQAMMNRVGPLLVWGNTPYGASSQGTTGSVQSLTLDDAKKFYGAHYGPKDSALVLVGDVTLEQARQLATEYFSKWSGTASAAATLPAAPTLGATHVVIVDKPGAPQTALGAFGVGVPADFPEMQTLQVMNYTLGGSFASRINMNLREQHGYTYGASSGFRAYREGGTFIAGGLVRTDVTGPAAKELMSEIRKFPASPSTEAELKQAKDASMQSLPGQFETTQAIANSMTNLFLLNRPPNYYAMLPAKYRAVTAADVARVAKEDVHPDQLIIVAAGDRKKIEPGLKEAGVGPVEVRDMQGNLVK